MRFLLAFLALLLPGPAAAQTKPIPGYVRVRIDTSAGPITVAIDVAHAPKTGANFLAYVDDGRFEGTNFYRASRSKVDATKGFIQGGIGTYAPRRLEPIPLETTTKTGIRHVDGTLSMARWGNDPNSATGNFSIMVGPHPDLDAHGSYQGYAAFGHVIAGMDVVKRILAVPSGGGTGAMAGQMILKPITIVRAVRLDGVGHPTTAFKPWLIHWKH